MVNDKKSNADKDISKIMRAINNTPLNGNLGGAVKLLLVFAAIGGFSYFNTNYIQPSVKEEVQKELAPITKQVEAMEEDLEEHCESSGKLKDVVPDVECLKKDVVKLKDGQKEIQTMIFILGKDNQDLQNWKKLNDTVK